MTALVHLRALEHDLGGLRAAEGVTLTITYERGENTTAVVTGRDVVLGGTTTLSFENGLPVEPVSLEGSGADFCAHFVITQEGNPLPVLSRFLRVPADGEHSIGDLEVVDPETFAPLPAMPPSVQELLEEARHALASVTEGATEVGEAVAAVDRALNAVQDAATAAATSAATSGIAKEAAEGAASTASTQRALAQQSASDAGRSSFTAGQAAATALGHSNDAGASASAADSARSTASEKASAAEIAAAAAQAAAGSVSKGTPNGVAGLDAGARVPEVNLPERLSPSQLSSTIAAVGAVPVSHGSNAAYPRPAGAAMVIWTGTVQPQNMVGSDLYIGPSPDSTAPSTPTGVTATQEGNGVRVAWSAASDNVGVTGYTVYRGTTSGFTPAAGNAIANPTALNVLDANPGVGTWYYKVVARDAAGNVSAPSSAASATIAPPAEWSPAEILSDWHTYFWAEQASGSNGAALATLADGSGNGHPFGDFDTDTTRRPTLNTADAQLNGKKSVVFDGSNDVVKTDVFTAVGQPWSFAMIGYAANSGALAAFFDAENGTTSRGRHQRDTSNIHNIFAGASVAGKAAEKFLITGEFNGTTSKLMINGTEYTGSTGTVASITRLYLGARRDATWLASLRLAFFGVTARSFTSAETAAMKARAAQTYGVVIA